MIDVDTHVPHAFSNTITAIPVSVRGMSESVDEAADLLSKRVAPRYDFPWRDVCTDIRSPREGTLVRPIQAQSSTRRIHNISNLPKVEGQSYLIVACLDITQWPHATGISPQAPGHDFLHGLRLCSFRTSRPSNPPL